MLFWTFFCILNWFSSHWSNSLKYLAFLKSLFAATVFRTSVNFFYEILIVVLGFCHDFRETFLRLPPTLVISCNILNVFFSKRRKVVWECRRDHTYHHSGAESVQMKNTVVLLKNGSPMHKFTNFRDQYLKLFEIVIFGRKKSFLDFYLVCNRFCFKILRPLQQNLEMVIFGQI